MVSGIVVQDQGMPENTVASKTGGGIAKKARVELESKTGKKVVTSGNYLPTTKKIKEIVE